MQHAQQLGLKSRRGFADFIQKNRAAVSLLKQPDMILIGAGKCAALVAKQHAFQQLLGQRRAVFANKRALGAVAGVVQRARQQLFAHAGFALNQHGDVVHRHLGQQGADAVQRAVGGAHDAVHGKGVRRLLALGRHPAAHPRLAGFQLDIEQLVFALQGGQPRRALHGEQQRIRPPGLQQVLIDAGLVDGGDDVGVVGVARQNNARHLGPALAHQLEKRHAGHVRHALVADHHMDEFVLQNGQRFVCAGGGEHLEGFFQRAPQGFQRADFIVHDQDNGQGGGHGVSGGCNNKAAIISARPSAGVAVSVVAPTAITPSAATIAAVAAARAVRGVAHVPIAACARGINATQISVQRPERRQHPHKQRHTQDGRPVFGVQAQPGQHGHGGIGHGVQDGL